jgi:hypothetical protein
MDHTWPERQYLPKNFLPQISFDANVQLAGSSSYLIRVPPERRSSVKTDYYIYTDIQTLLFPRQAKLASWTVAAGSIGSLQLRLSVAEDLPSRGPCL